jgi:GDP-L-fucose synthase
MNYFKDKKILITGGTGMIGVALANKLLRQGAILTVVSLDDINPFKENNVIFRKLDLRNYDNCLEACKNNQFIFHVAGVKGSPKVAINKPASFFVPTIMFNTCLLEAAFRSNAEHILYTSSIGVYSPADIFFEDSVWKTFPSQNDKFAGWAKRMGELQLESYKTQYNFSNFSIVRPANVYGPYDNFDLNNAMVIPSLIKRAIEEESDYLEIWGDGSAIRDFIYADDVAQGMMHVVENKISEPINIGSGSGVKIRDLVEIIVKKIPNKKLSIKWDISKPTGDKIRILDTMKAERLGFKCTTSLEEGIEKTINWFLKNRKHSSSKYNSFNEK